MDRLLTLEMFVAVAGEGGFAAAARKIGSSPPAVTRGIAALCSLALRDENKRLIADAGGVDLVLAAMRAHASIAIAASGIIGMYSVTRSPFSTPSPISALAMRQVSA